MKYAHLKENTNKLLGWYDDSIHSEIPTPNVKVDEEVWQEAININANCYENEKFIVKDFRTQEELLKQEYQTKLTAINNEYNNAIANLSRGVPDTERSTWTKQEQEAKEVIAGNVNVPMLSALANARGIPLEYLAEKVIEKANLYSTIVGQLTGKRQRDEDLLKEEYKDIL